MAVDDRVSVSASFADIDNDGDADLYVTAVRAGNLLFENDGSGRFRDVTAQSGTGYAGHSSSAVFFDYDADGLLDLYVANVGRYTSERLRPMSVDPVGNPYESGNYEFPGRAGGRVRGPPVPRSLGEQRAVPQPGRRPVRGRHGGGRPGGRCLVRRRYALWT